MELFVIGYLSGMVASFLLCMVAISITAKSSNTTIKNLILNSNKNKKMLITVSLFSWVGFITIGMIMILENR